MSNSYEVMDPYFGVLVANRMTDLVTNLTSIRDGMISRNRMDGRRRDINDECQYPATEQLEPKLLKEMFDRSPFAEMVCSILPEMCWEHPPEVYETEDEEVVTSFEDSWRVLPRGMRGKSWYRKEQGNPVFNHLKDLDIKAGIGQFGILILGFSDVDGQSVRLSDPIAGVDRYEDSVDPVFNYVFNEQTGAYEKEKVKVADGSDPEDPDKIVDESLEFVPKVNLLWMRAFPQSQVRVDAYDMNESSPRYTQPIRYTVRFTEDNKYYEGTATDRTDHVVHWTRVIHLDSEGTVSRMQQVWNELLNLRKIYSGSGEGYWQACSPGLSFETHPQMGGDVVVNEQRVKNQYEKFITGLQRVLITVGMAVKPIAPTMVDPSPYKEINIEALCVKLRMPKRIVMGSERGELASSQDVDQRNKRITNRHTTYLTPMVMIPFIDRLIAVGCLAPPDEEEGYCIEWPKLNVITPLERAQIANMDMDTISKFIQSNAQFILPTKKLYTTFLDKTDDEAEDICRAALEQDEEDPMVSRAVEEQERADQEKEEELQRMEEASAQQAQQKGSPFKKPL